MPFNRFGYGLVLWLLVGNRVFEVTTAVAQAPLEPDFVLNGVGDNVDTIAFWEADAPEETLMLVTAKSNSLVEVWRFPFASSSEQLPIQHSSFANSQVNGIVVDQVTDLAYVSIAKPASTVSSFALPAGSFVRSWINGQLPLGDEPGIELHRPLTGSARVLVTSDNERMLHALDTAGDTLLFSRDMGMELETLLADDYYQAVYVPDENGRTGVDAYNPDITPYERNGRSHFGEGVFQGDAEGILLYRCQDNGQDNGQGWIVVSDQQRPLTDFEFFDRFSWQQVGTLHLEGVENTDGIASTQRPLPGYPLGLFAAINDDTEAVGVGWDKVLITMGLSCADKAAAAEGVGGETAVASNPAPTPQDTLSWVIWLVLLGLAGMILAIIIRHR